MHCLDPSIADRSVLVRLPCRCHAYAVKSITPTKQVTGQIRRSCPTLACATSASSSHSNSHPLVPRFVRSGKWLDTIMTLRHASTGRHNLRHPFLLCPGTLTCSNSHGMSHSNLPLISLQLCSLSQERGGGAILAPYDHRGARCNQLGLRVCLQIRSVRGAGAAPYREGALPSVLRAVFARRLGPVSGVPTEGGPA